VGGSIDTQEVIMQISDKVFVVTGGGNGIGREVVLELARRGGRVAAVDLNLASLEETVSLAGASAGDITAHQLSVADRAAVDALPDQVLAAHGQVDGVLNIAGIIQRFVHVDQLSIEEIERVMAVNFWGTLYMDTAFLPLLKERPQAALLNVSSMGGLVPVPGQGAYGASKGAVKLLTECLYAELRGTGVAVTVVFPGAVGTNITGNSGVAVPTVTMAGGKTPKVTAADDAGRQIVDAVAHGKFRVLIGGDARMLDRLARISPTRAITTVADQMKKMLGI
jgi:NAD(P)-dependent dehydrogenase (short-subunit alcohol dehydrogenase family)